MKNVVRTKQPSSLKKNSEKWTNELMAAVALFKKNGVRVQKALQEKYRTQSVKHALTQMYSDDHGQSFCCFCEHEIDVIDWPHIEHRKPKDINLFPEETYNWDNLHLVCTICNTSKSNQWDNQNPILDSVSDVPIEDHLSFDVDAILGVSRTARTLRGDTTIKHANLERDKLRKARLKVYIGASKMIMELKKNINSPEYKRMNDRIKEKFKGPHGSLLKWIYESFMGS